MFAYKGELETCCWKQNRSIKDCECILKTSIKTI